MKNTLSVCFFFYPIFALCAQKNSLESTVGHASLMGAGASGYEVGVAYTRQLNNKSALSFDVCHAFSQARGLMADYDDKDNLIYRDQTNPAPLPSGFTWTQDAFPIVRFRSKPDRFFSFNLGVHYWRTVWEQEKWSLKAAIGATGSFRDEIKMLKVVHINDLKILSQNLGDYYLPVMQYRTYLDAAATAQLRLSWRAGKRLSLGLNNRLLYYPASDHWWFNAAAQIGFDF